MSYFDGVVVPVPTGSRETYKTYAAKAAAVFKANGAKRVTECWGSDVPGGKVTSLPMAVKLEANETVVFSFIEWPSKEVRDAAWSKMMSEPLFDHKTNPMPFDGKRMIFGGFETLIDL